MVSVSFLGPRGRSSPLFSLAPHLTRRRVALEISKEGTSREEGTGFLSQKKKKKQKNASMSFSVPQSIVSFILQHHEYFPKAKLKKNNDNNKNKSREVSWASHGRLAAVCSQRRELTHPLALGSEPRAGAPTAGRPEWEAAARLLPSPVPLAGASPSGYTRSANLTRGVRGKELRRLRRLLLLREGRRLGSPAGERAPLRVRSRRPHLPLAQRLAEGLAAEMCRGGLLAGASLAFSASPPAPPSLFRPSSMWMSAPRQSYPITRRLRARPFCVPD